MADCIVPGCVRDATNGLASGSAAPTAPRGGRARPQRTSATSTRRLVPRVMVIYEGATNGAVQVRTQGATEPIVRRTRDIKT